jgi:hypothetical protein
LGELRFQTEPSETLMKVHASTATDGKQAGTG